MNALQSYRFTSTVLASAIAATFSLSGLAQSTTGFTKLADEPVAASGKVPPTIMMTVDDSSSMTWEHTPEGLLKIQQACWGFYDELRECTIFRNQVSEDGGEMGLDNSVINDDLRDSANPWKRVRAFFKYGQPPMLTAGFNKLAYDPKVDYVPPRGYPDIVGKTDADLASFSGEVLWGLKGTPATWAGRPYQVNLKTSKFDYTNSKYFGSSNSDQAFSPEQQQKFKTRYEIPDAIWDKYKTAFPPHYFTAKVEWCNKPKMVGITPGVEDCQSEYEENFKNVGTGFIYPRFSEWKVVVLDFENYTEAPTTFSYSYYDAAQGMTVTKTRTRAEEFNNYANWVAYYRNRLAATKTAASYAFDSLCDPAASGADCGDALVPNVGFATINNVSGTSPLNSGLDMAPAPFTGSARETFFSYLSNFRWTDGGTPLPMAVYQVGNRFVANPGQAYIRYTCQRSYNILFTDGLWNNGAGTSGTLTAVGDEDTKLMGDLNSEVTLYGTSLKNKDTLLPPPIAGAEGGSSTSNTLADAAFYFWRKDLLTAADDVESVNNDPATWQHLNFSGMGFGVRGRLPDRNQSATLEGIIKGDYFWPAPSAGDNLPNVDDLWHAAVNGRGRYISTSTPSGFRSGLLSILTEIMNIGGARKGAAFTSPNLVDFGDQSVYFASFGGGWSGDIIKSKIDSGGEMVETNAKTAAEQMSSRMANAKKAGNWDVRTIITSNGNTAFNFTPAEFETNMASHTSMLNSLGTTPEQRANVINYFRGQTDYESDDVGGFRDRADGLLGDFVNAKPVVVGYPSCYKNSGDKLVCNFRERDNPGYEKFYDDHKGRALMVYAASNDGMLHAFDEDLNEKWAFVPSELFRSREDKGIINLIYQEWAEPEPFKHYFYVDATPRTFDVRWSEASGSGAGATAVSWKTLLVGGLGKGGTSYYALDVTDGATGTATGKYLWEYTNSNMGYSYATPILVKTPNAAWQFADGDHKWMAILPSGYNNGKGAGSAKDSGDGTACLYFVDVTDGTKKAELCTTEGSPSNPLNLVYIASYIADEKNQIATAVYGADDHGNIWRFNLESTDASEWKVNKLAMIPDDLYVTTEPYPMLSSDGRRYVVIGTGGFRNGEDLRDTDAQNYLFAFRDGDKQSSSKAAAIDMSSLSATASDLPMLKVKNDSIDPPTLDAANSSKLELAGWFMPMPEGYHINVEPTGLSSSVVWAANKYTVKLDGNGYLADPTAACSKSLFTGMVFARDVTNGASLIEGKAFVDVPRGVASMQVVRYLDENGKPKAGFLASDYEKKMVDLNGENTPGNALPLPGGEDRTQGIPQRANIRYVTKTR